MKRLISKPRMVALFAVVWIAFIAYKISNEDLAGEARPEHIGPAVEDAIHANDKAALQAEFDTATTGDGYAKEFLKWLDAPARRTFKVMPFSGLSLKGTFSSPEGGRSCVAWSYAKERGNWVLTVLPPTVSSC